MPTLLSPLRLRGLTLPNRMGIPPMLMYAAEDGVPQDFHLVHYGSGYGLIIVEATGVCAGGRITPRDCGLWSDASVPAFRRITEFVHGQGSKICVQLNHSGRKGSQRPPTSSVRRCSVPIEEDYHAPRELSVEEIAEIVAQFGSAARRAVSCGFDAVEIHAAHGYLLHSFLSPVTNHRTDAYRGDSFEGRSRLLREVCACVRASIPVEMPLLVRLSVEDYCEGGLVLADSLCLIKELMTQCEVDLIDCSTGALVEDQHLPSDWRHQIYCARALHAAGIPTSAVGGICTSKEAGTIIEEEEADLVYGDGLYSSLLLRLIGRGSLRNALDPRRAAVDLQLPIPPYPENYTYFTHIPRHSTY